MVEHEKDWVRQAWVDWWRSICRGRRDVTEEFHCALRLPSTITFKTFIARLLVVEYYGVIQGNLVAPDADLPMHLGLHHHGDEPQRAGYTLNELFQLSRSMHLQQRVMSLTTLASVIDRARHGAFHEQVSKPIISVLMDAGLVFVLRWALDDSIDSSISAAINCLHKLLVSLLKPIFGWI